MKTLFYYCYYKISKFYEDWGESNGHVSGNVVLFGSIGFNLLSIVIVCLWLMDKKITSEFVVIFLVCCAIIGIPFISKKKFKALSVKYRGEKHRKLKSWLVLLYCIGSIVLYCVSMILCDYWVGVKE